MWSSRPLRRTRTKAWPSRALPLVLTYMPARGPVTMSAYECPATALDVSPEGTFAVEVPASDDVAALRALVNEVEPEVFCVEGDEAFAVLAALIPSRREVSSRIG